MSGENVSWRAGRLRVYGEEQGMAGLCSVFGSERGRKHQKAWDADLDGLGPSPGLITSRDVLSWATIGGAEVAAISSRSWLTARA